jgi:membrane protein DedA with SNARE-associated domain
VSNFITSLVLNIQDLVVSVGYPGVFLAAFAENFFPPLPSELIFPFLGFVAGTGHFNLLLVILFGTLGTIFGAFLWYGLGYVLGRANLKLYIDRYGRIFRIKFSDVEKAEEWFARHDVPVIFFGRLVPIVRTLISVPAGFVKMPFYQFSSFTFLGSLIWVGFLTSAGYLLGERWEEISRIVGNYEFVIEVILIIAVLVGIFVLLHRRAKNTKYR